MAKGKECKSYPFELKAMDEAGRFSGYASVFGNIDSAGDVIEPGAFEETLEADFGRIKIMSNHDCDSLPIGKPLELREDGHGLWVDGMISGTQLGRDVRTLMLDKVLNEMSIGFDCIDSYLDEQGIRHITKIRLWEISVVTWAANDQAVVTDVKSDDSEPGQKEGPQEAEPKAVTLEEAVEAMAKSLADVAEEIRAALLRPSPLSEAFGEGLEEAKAMAEEAVEEAKAKDPPGTQGSSGDPPEDKQNPISPAKKGWSLKIVP